MKYSLNQIINYSLYKNALWLITNSIVLAGFGFFFWTIVTRLYTVEEVGIASTLISSLELITTLSLAGFNIALIRYLPRSGEKNKTVSSCFLLSMIIALFIGTIFILGLEIFSPKLIFLKELKLQGILFITFILFYVFFTLTDSIFISLRKTKFVVIKNSIFSTLKLILPVFLISLGAFGIFSSMAISAAVAFLVSVLFLSIILSIKFKLTIKKEIIKKMFKFSSGNYLANTLQYTPAFVLPLIITNNINPETTAYFYLALMMAGLIFIIPTATSFSLLAEGSHDENEIKNKVKNAFKFSYLLLIPAVIFFLIFGKYLLLLFGEPYSENAFRLLQVLSLSSLFFAVNIIYVALKNIQHKIKKVITINLIVASSILILSYLLLDYGLIGIGIAWISGQIGANLFILYDLIRSKNVNNI